MKVFLLTLKQQPNYLFDHELGNDDDGNAMTNVFIESSDFDLGEGEEFQFVSRIIPDVTFNGTGSTGASGQKVNLVLKKRNFPGEDLSVGATWFLYISNN